MPLLRWRRDLHLPVRRRDNHAVLIETRRHGIGVQDRPDALDVRTLGARLRHIRRARVRGTPVECLGVRMHPEEPLVPRLPMSLSNRLPSVLVQELSNHRLGDRVDDSRIRRLWDLVSLRRDIGRFLGGNRRAARSVRVPFRGHRRSGGGHATTGIGQKRGRRVLSPLVLLLLANIERREVHCGKSRSMTC